MDRSHIKYRFIERSVKPNGKVSYYFRRDKGDRVRLPDDYGSPGFLNAYHAALNGKPIAQARKMTAGDIKIVEVESSVRIAVAKAKHRARRKGLECDIDPDWALNLVRKANHRCAISNVPFLSQTERKSFMHPFCPSIDRIEPSLGYTKGNCRVIIFALNAMISDWGEETMVMVARGFMYEKNKKSRSYPLREIPLPLAPENIVIQQPLTDSK